MKTEKVSIVTPCYNGEKYLERFLKSILNQSYGNIELIFINDGSTDQTEEIIKKYKEEFDLHNIELTYLFQENAGEIILTIVAAVIQIVRIILLVYTAMAIGAAAKRHKVFYSVLTFIVILIIIAIIGTLTNFNLIEMLNGSMAVDNAGIGVHADAGKGMVVAGYVKLLAGQCITDAIYSVIFFFVTTWFLKNKLNLE